MKFNYALLPIVGLLCGAAISAWGQGTFVGDGTFVNFDFESANVPVPQNGQFSTPVAVAQAMPGWTAYLGTGAINEVVPNLSSLTGASISIITPQWGAGPVFQGRYMVLLQAAESPSTLTPTTAAIGQTGQIPLTAQSLLFEAKTSGMQITFNGAPVSVKVFGRAANFTFYQADVSSFAGQTGELRFTALQAFGFGSAFLDDLGFYSQTVPEPETWLLFGLGIVGLTCFNPRCGGRPLRF